jgi:hypothetical protein
MGGACSMYQRDGKCIQGFLLKNVGRRDCLEVGATGPLVQILVRPLKCCVHCYVFCFPCRPGVSPCCKLYSTLCVMLFPCGHGVYACISGLKMCCLLEDRCLLQCDTVTRSQSSLSLYPAIFLTFRLFFCHE